MSCTITIEKTVDFVRTKPSLTAVLGNPVAGYGGNAVPIRLANKVLQEVLAEPFAWKWNRRVPAPFITNQLQQDYSTSILDLGWLEDGERIEINNPMFRPPSPPNYQIRGLEVVRELMACSFPGIPSQLAWVPNSEAIAGDWVAGTVYVNPATLTQMPVQPLTQIWDRNGNLQVLTTFGILGNTEPTWNTVANGTTVDGSAVWTMADPDGITWRLSPPPTQSGIVYQIQPYYQKKPTLITTVKQFWTIPDELSAVYEAGLTAYAYDASENETQFEKSYSLFQLLIKKALRSGDREQEGYCLYPGRSITGISGTVTKGDQNYPPGLFSDY